VEEKEKIFCSTYQRGNFLKMYAATGVKTVTWVCFQLDQSLGRAGPDMAKAGPKDEGRNQ